MKVKENKNQDESKQDEHPNHACTQSNLTNLYERKQGWIVVSQALLNNFLTLTFISRI